MQRQMRQLAIVVTAALMVVGITSAWAQVMGLSAPLNTRFVGTFEAFDEKKEGGLNMLTVYIEKQKFLFNVSEVYTQYERDPVGLVLKYIDPPELYFSGNPHRLTPLTDSANLGKKITIEGFLYAGENLFTVMAVKVG
jgi:hypothetical protein